MKYLSVCSGIEAASVAWHKLGWTPVGFSEIEPFPSAVLTHRFPNVPNYGDMTKHKEWPLEPGSINLLVGGTPCQSFSVAGLRKGLSDPRGGLMLTYLEIAQRLRPRWVVWENVPGVLSSGGGRDFGSFLGALGQLGYQYAYRVLDAQWCRTHGHSRAVPQRRRRVFVVGHLGDWNAAAQVLFERESVQRDSAPRRAKGEEAAADAGGCAASVCSKWSKGTGGPAGDECQNLTLQPAGYRWQNNRDGLVSDGTVSALRASAGSSGFHEMNHPMVAQAHAFYSTGGTHGVNQHPEVSPAVKVGSGLGIPSPPAVAVAFKPGQSAAARSIGAQEGVACTLEGGGGGNNKQAVAVSVGVDLYNQELTGDVHCPLRTAGGHGAPAVAAPTITATNDPSRSPQSAEITQQVATVHASTMTVRRLTPRECERLQGFPDDWTAIPWRGKPVDQCPDGPRYKALGNSMAVNCMEWIGERIAAIENQANKRNET